MTRFDQFNQWVRKYLVWAFPFIIAVTLWNTFETEKEIILSPSIAKHVLWDVLGYHFMIWLLTLVYFIFSLVLSKSQRDVVLRRIANIKERDEREAQITGKASVSSMLSTLSIVVLLLFISLFSFNLSRIPKNEQIENRSKYFSTTINFHLLDEPKIQKDTSGETIVESKDLPLSKSSILLLIILWYLISFNYFARKYEKEA